MRRYILVFSPEKLHKEALFSTGLLQIFWWINNLRSKHEKPELLKKVVRSKFPIAKFVT